MHFSLQRISECNPQEAFSGTFPGWFYIQSLILSCFSPAEGHRFLRTCLLLLLERSDLFLAATAIRINYAGSGWTVATPPLQPFIRLPLAGQGGVWDLSVFPGSGSSRSIPSSNALEGNVEAIQSGRPVQLS